MSPSYDTRNSVTLRLGSTLATANWPRSAFGRYTVLRVPEPSCSATYPFFSVVRCPSTWQLPSFSTVTGICSPVSVKTRVIPTFCAITPERIGVLPVLSVRYLRTGAKKLELDFDVNTGGQVELHQRVHRLRCRIDNVEKALVRAHLELLAALLVDMRRTVDGELLDAGRQRNGSANLGTGTFRRIHDLAGRRIEDTKVERLETDANILAVHCRCLFLRRVMRVVSGE